ncbi:hypothetical protein JX265_006554 [Neoarthrinium moseri]|uniref:Transcription initiation factor TFIID subunit 4 n=1 Tax=Neoarthrinium moseri TaxID=1658444 RepID=A0A9Q0AQM2_9PEZI|nr:hypothetical protein JX265_006554 [Neoarthrinium moseri]
MSQQQPTMAQTAPQSLPQNRPFSPAIPQQQQQHSPSPTLSQQGHPAQQPQQQQQQQQSQQPVRPRATPDARSPTFPTTSYTNSPGPGHASPAVRTPTSGLASPSTPYPPQPQQQQQQQQQQSQPQTQHQYQHPQYNTAPIAQPNGRVTPGTTASRYSAPPGQANVNHATPQAPSPMLPQTSQISQPPTPAAHVYSNATFSPAPQSATTPATGAMGPPLATAIKPPVQAKTYAYDMDDTLQGTGINLDEEEQLMNEFEARTGFGAFPPRGRGSLFGAGPANQPPEDVQAKTQEELVAETADRAWNEAAHRYATSVVSEVLSQGFIHPGMMHYRMSKIAAHHNLELNLDPKPPNPSAPLGRFSHPNTWEKPEIRVTTKTSPDGTIVSTKGSFLPKDSYLIDQIALLSLATKERMGELLAEANLVACNRQQSAHGAIPQEWADAAEPRGNMDSAVSPRTNPLKRPASELSNGLPTPVSEPSPTNQFAGTMVTLGKRTRDVEEARLRKRQKRAEQAAEREKNPDGANASRSGSVAPGTPGAAAPDQSETKPMSKKESKKAARLQDTSSVTVNSTVNQFMGRKGKKYSWMAGGGGGSGASTPRGPATGPASGAGGSSGRNTKGPLTQDPSQKLGELREDSAKGKNIQMRDWVQALELHGRSTDYRVLQQAYIKLDRSDWGDKAVVPTPTPAPVPSPTPSTAATPSAAALAGVATPVASTPVASTPMAEAA